MATQRAEIAAAAALLLLATTLQCSSARKVQQPEPRMLPGAEIHAMTSGAGREYRIYVYRPTGEPPPAGFPVLYVLDGDDLFDMAASIARPLAQWLRGSGVGPGVIIGIGYPGPSRRSLDYTPAAPPAPLETRLDGTPYPTQETGGADAFLDFLEYELIPTVERTRPVDPSHRTLLGHSYGGLFTLHTLFKRPTLFRTYVASSPSIWWNGGFILREEQDFAKAAIGQTFDARLLIAVGEFEQTLSPVELRLPSEQRRERLHHNDRRRMVDNAQEMARRLGDVAPSGLSVTFQAIGGASHTTVVPTSVSLAIAAAFGTIQ